MRSAPLTTSRNSAGRRTVARESDGKERDDQCGHEATSHHRSLSQACCTSVTSHLQHRLRGAVAGAGCAEPQRAPCRRSSRIPAARAGFVRMSRASAATLSGVKSSWINSGTTRLSGDQVGHGEGADPDERAAEPVGERRQAVHHHHRTFVERGLHGDRPRRDESDVGNLQELVGAARRARSAARLQSSAAAPAGRRKCAARGRRRTARRAAGPGCGLPQPRGRAESPALRCGGCPAAARRSAPRPTAPGSGRARPSAAAAA